MGTHDLPILEKRKRTDEDERETSDLSDSPLEIQILPRLTILRGNGQCGVTCGTGKSNVIIISCFP